MKTKIIITTLPGIMSSVHIEASGKEVFKGLLHSFKSQVRAKYRYYSGMTQSWCVSADGFAALDAWLADVQARRPQFEIVRNEIALSQSEPADSWQSALAESLRLGRQLLEEMTKGKKIQR